MRTVAKLSDLSRSNVILCHCRGQMDQRLSLDEIKQSLQRMAPGLSVFISDNLCQTGTLAQFERQWEETLVVGACSELRGGYHPPDSASSINIVDMLKESHAAFGVSQATERVKLLLWAQVKRMTQFRGLRPDKLKLHMPEGKFSRRELFGLLRPFYEVIPYVNSAGCPGSENCDLCQRACPVHAVIVRQRSVAIDPDLCSGCGDCVAACPQRAIVYPTFSLEQLDKEMEGLLGGEWALPGPRMIAFTCQRCQPAYDRDADGCGCPDSMLPVALPCLAMASPWLILRAFDLGAQGVAVISSKGRCPSGFHPSRWAETTQFVQALLKSWGIAPERLTALEATGLEEVEQKLVTFAREVATLTPTRLRLCQPENLPADGLLLPALVKGMNEKLAPAAAGVIADGTVPFGRLELDARQCSGCGLCAASCPTAALTLALIGQGDSYQLLFQHDMCVACNACLEACPEKCLRVERVLELDKLGKPPVLVFQDNVVRCRQCGSSIGPQAMRNRLGAKVAEIAGIVRAQSELCPVCQVKAEISSSMLAR